MRWWRHCENILDYASRHGGAKRDLCRLESDAVLCGARRIALAELHLAGTAAGHRFEAKRKAYLSPRTVASNVHACGSRCIASPPRCGSCIRCTRRTSADGAMRGWMDSPERHSLLREAADLVEQVHARIVRAGFAQWFAPGSEGGPAGMEAEHVVLLLLYPVVFLFGLGVQTPLLIRVGRLPFWLALFVGNVASVLLLNWLVPWTSHAFDWWLNPAAGRRTIDITGTALMFALYGACLLTFSLL